MKNPPRAALALLLVGALAIAADPPTSHAAEGCSVTSIGVDTSLAHDELVVWDHNFWNQLFVTSDTLIHSITVWRIARDTVAASDLKIYIMGVDSSYGVLRPNAQDVLLDGPAVSAKGGDGIHPFPLTWTFDPPFALPHQGQFSFELKPPPCVGVTPILVSSTDPYPDGDIWQMDPGDCDVGCCPGPGPSYMDMAFQIEFCKPAVPTKPGTWGRVKASYR